MISSQIELALVTPNLEGELKFRSDSSRDKETCNLPLIALCMHEMSAYHTVMMELSRSGKRIRLDFP